MNGGSGDPETGRGPEATGAGTGGPGRGGAPGGSPGGAPGGALSGGEFAGIGIQFALVILVFTAGGVWLDRRLGSSPWFTIIGVFVGAAGGFYSMYRKVMAAQRLDAARRAANRR